MSQSISPSPLPDTGFLRQSQLIPGIVPFSASTLWRMVKAGAFPPPVKLSPRVTAWRAEDLRDWMSSRT
jgi:predicted DNA-binding transcriptional regulator AlpA